MNTRRKFILQGSMAAAALLAARPFKAIGAGNNLFLQPGNPQNHLVLMHTAGLQTEMHGATLNFIGAVKRKTANTILLDAGNSRSSINFDASVNDDTVFNGEDYRIITRAGTRTGIFTVTGKETGLFEKVNKLAAQLKKDEQCQVVICISQLGFSHKNKIDDKELAAKSTHIDIIIGAHPENYAAQPLTLPNSSRQEVIFQSAAASSYAFGKIEIGFDAKGIKNHVHILHKVPKKEGQLTAIIAA